MRRTLVLIVLVVTLAGCGGSSGGGGGGTVPDGPSGDPVAAVNGFVNAIAAKAFDKLDKLVCAAKRDDIIGGLTGGAPGAQALLDAMTFQVKDLKVEQKSVTGDSAVVHVTGSVTVGIDPAKGKDAVRQMLGASMPSGAQVTDQQVDQVMSAFGQTRALDSDVDVVKENGGWVVCSDLGTSAD